jgi:uncharacterized protein (TIGR03067 family)
MLADDCGPLSRTKEVAMRNCFVGFLAALVATSGISAMAGDAKEQAIEKERKKYAGTWRVTALEVDGNKASEEDARKITVVNREDGTWIIQVDGKEINKGTSEIDPAKKPKTIDFTADDGPDKGKPFLGIYQIDENTRKLCFAPSGKDRPTEFSSNPGSGHFLVTFERVKPE